MNKATEVCYKEDKPTSIVTLLPLLNTVCIILQLTLYENKIEYRIIK